MSLAACSGAAALRPDQRLEGLFEELAELAGQRNAIDGRIVEIVAEVDRDELWGATGARSVAALVAWKMGSSSGNANTIATVASRLEEFPRCAQGMREGRLSLDQVGVIAARAGEGSDEHYAELARCATVNQLRTAVKLEPRPEPDPRPEPQPSITKTSDEEFTCWRIKLPHMDAAKFDAALASHRDALVNEWKLDRENHGRASDNSLPSPKLPLYSLANLAPNSGKSLIYDAHNPIPPEQAPRWRRWRVLEVFSWRAHGDNESNQRSKILLRHIGSFVLKFDPNSN